MKPEGGFGGASFTPPAARITGIVVAACIAVEIAATLGGSGFAAELARHAALIPARLTGALAAIPGDVPAPLTLLTSLFLHAGWVHLALNLVFLWWVGRHVEGVVGPARFVLLYLFGGVAGGLLQVAVAPLSTAAVVGASGAIAGVFGAYAVFFARSRAAGQRVFGVPVSGAVLTATWYALTWIGLQLLTAVAFNAGGGGVAIWAHIGGFVVGLVLAQPFARRRGRSGA